ncbi:type 4 prepilin-like proteins leader peptide-processing enzyme [Roseovarius sp. A-2]|uniref:prepilin peptidase n=1 Tax=Roseovarius sp. A-2 TaxID=1570360 RepID=UPI0009B58639|nr:A24 family peptidase [Roseovarius sp. A-2]GAW33306.1 type 4 prepilin-like proteins leader peptide-processing enzyme [Roseovarius sp. A-2]
MPDTAPLAFFLILSGAAVGSFLAAWADRLPRGESIVTTPSSCRGCGMQIAWRDLVPVASWLVLSGRCRRCGEAIPRRLFYAEIIGMGLAILAIWVAATPLEMVLGALWLWCLFGLMLCDLSDFRLPDSLTGLLVVTGAAMSWADSARGLPDALIGAGAGAGAFLALRLAYQLVRRREGLGLGDVKLMAGIGAGLGWAALPMVALVAALGALAVTGALWYRGARASGGTEIPFGAYLAAAAAVIWLWL